MGKGEETRQRLLKEAAALFNQVGYHAGSIQDLMNATGLKKGGIYRHFEDKEALTLAAFQYAIDRTGERFTEALSSKLEATERLLAIVAVFEQLPDNPPVPGGCPTMNAAIEADDANPALRAAAREAMAGLKRVIKKTLNDGEKRGELRRGLDRDAIADVLLAQLEGAVMLSKLHGNSKAMKHAVQHSRSLIFGLRAEPVIKSKLSTR